MHRRLFIGAAAASIFAPKFGRWFKENGLYKPGYETWDLELSEYVYAISPEGKILVAKHKFPNAPLNVPLEWTWTIAENDVSNSIMQVDDLGRLCLRK